MLKGREFEHEREIRIVTKCLADQETVRVPTPTFKDCIRKVIISPYIDQPSAEILKLHIEALFAQEFGEAPAPAVLHSTIRGPGSDFRNPMDVFAEVLGPAKDSLPL